MRVELNHTIVHVTDKTPRPTDLAEILGLDPPTTFGPFLVLTLANGVSLDFADDHGATAPQHYAFLVSEEEFDAIRRGSSTAAWVLGRPLPPGAGEINTNDGGRGVYWEARRAQPGDHHRPVRRIGQRSARAHLIDHVGQDVDALGDGALAERSRSRRSGRRGPAWRSGRAHPVDARPRGRAAASTTAASSRSSAAARRPGAGRRRSRPARARAAVPASAASSASRRRR